MKVLIFTVSSGNGHNSGARYIKEKLLAENPQTEIKVVDAFEEYTSKIRSWTFKKGYFFACNHLLGLYNHFYKRAEDSRFKDRFKNGASKTASGFEYGMLKTINEFKPDLIFSTYVYCTVALNKIEFYYKLPCKVASLALDYGISPYWESCADSLDYMFLTNADMVDEFIDRGFSKEQLIVAGVPVSERFYHPLEKTAAREKLGLKPDVFTITVMKASFFHLPLDKLVREIYKIDGDCQVVIINGKDEIRRKKIEKFLSFARAKGKGDGHINVINLGYTTDVADYMSASDLVIGKAGGLSVTETVNAGLPSLIIKKLPQQEIYNKDYLVGKGCALTVDEHTLSSTVNDLRAHPEKLEKMRENALALRNDRSLDIIYETLSGVKDADYSNWSFTDGRLKAKRNIKNAIKNREKA